MRLPGQVNPAPALERLLRMVALLQVCRPLLVVVLLLLLLVSASGGAGGGREAEDEFGAAAGAGLPANGGAGGGGETEAGAAAASADPERSFRLVGITRVSRGIPAAAREDAQASSGAAVGSLGDRERTPGKMPTRSSLKQLSYLHVSSFIISIIYHE